MSTFVHVTNVLFTHICPRVPGETLGVQEKQWFQTVTDIKQFVYMIEKEFILCFVLVFALFATGYFAGMS